MRYILTALIVLALVITSRATMSYLTSPTNVIAISDNEGQTIQGGQYDCTTYWSGGQVYCGGLVKCVDTGLKQQCPYKKTFVSNGNQLQGKQCGKTSKTCFVCKVESNECGSVDVPSICPCD